MGASGNVTHTSDEITLVAEVATLREWKIGHEKVCDARFWLSASIAGAGWAILVGIASWGVLKDQENQKTQMEALQGALEAVQSSRELAAYYPTCAIARAAGVTPLYAGRPGYGAHLDRDGNGIACE